MLSDREVLEIVETYHAALNVVEMATATRTDWNRFRRAGRVLAAVARSVGVVDAERRLINATEVKAGDAFWAMEDVAIRAFEANAAEDPRQSLDRLTLMVNDHSMAQHPFDHLRTSAQIIVGLRDEALRAELRAMMTSGECWNIDAVRPLLRLADADLSSVARRSGAHPKTWFADVLGLDVRQVEDVVGTRFNLVPGKRQLWWMDLGKMNSEYAAKINRAEAGDAPTTTDSSALAHTRTQNDSHAA